ncbi:hypothetical protein PSECIP111951_04190 [Pseudoalteromonas holothuriae]|uniref:Uncharacterized protein n=1 Tax=Pseudoalteromonas holothuriae TaxID=2963714 RepID=A0ABN8US25_9GAMM|nr:hypothetical protein PSECIP111951_04190 [Pseudoalteromonas sp. CIP111951]
MPYIPPAPQAGCNAVASIIMIAVAVVATIYTAGAAASTFAISSFTAGAIGGAVGSIASQVAGKAMGVVDSFSWGQVAISAITAGVSRGAGTKLAQIGSAADKGSFAAHFARAGELTKYGRAAVSVASSVSGVMANKLINNRSNFSWANVASSAVGASMGARLPGEAVSEFDFGKELGLGVVRAGVSHTVNKALGGDSSWNNRDVATDAFGNAIGNSIVAGMQEKPKPQNSGNSSQGQNSQNPQVAGQNGATDLNKRYKEGDFIGHHEDGRKMYAGSVDENGQVISQVIPLEREEAIIELPTNNSPNDGNFNIDWSSLYGLNSFGNQPNLHYKKSFNFSSYQEAQFASPIRDRGFFGQAMDDFSQWKSGVFDSYESLALDSKGGFGTAAVSFLETPTRLGLGVLEGGLAIGGLLFDSSVRQDAWSGLNHLYDNYDTVIPGAVNSWMDQSWNEQLADVFVFGGEGLLGGTAGKLSYSGVKYSAQWSKMEFNYNYRHYFTGTQTLDSDQVFYSFKNSNYFDPNSSFEPMELWMTPELMSPNVAIPKLALPFDSGYDTIMKVTLPQGSKIMNPRPVWSLFGKPGGGIETRSYNNVTSDMYQTYSVDEFFRGGN